MRFTLLYRGDTFGDFATREEAEAARPQYHAMARVIVKE